MRKRTPKDIAIHRHRERVFVLVVKSHLLRAQSGQECRRSRWLIARSRYVLRRLATDAKPQAAIPG